MNLESLDSNQITIAMVVVFGVAYIVWVTTRRALRTVFFLLFFAMGTAISWFGLWLIDGEHPLLTLAMGFGLIFAWIWSRIRSYTARIASTLILGGLAKVVSWIIEMRS